MPEALGITVVFGAVDDGVDHLASHETVIASAVDHFDLADAIDELIKDAGAKTADGGFTFAGDAAGGDTVVAFVKEGEHLGEKAGRILAIGVHDCDVVTSGVLEAGEHGGFFAEIAREGEIFDTVVGVAKGFELGEGVIAAAVVNED